MSVRATNLTLRSEYFLVDVAVLAEFFGKILILFLLGMPGVSLVGAYHCLVTMPQRLLLHVLYIYGSSLPFSLPILLDLPRKGPLIILQSALRVSLIQCFQTLVRIIALQGRFFVGFR